MEQLQHLRMVSNHFLFLHAEPHGGREHHQVGSKEVNRLALLQLYSASASPSDLPSLTSF